MKNLKRVIAVILTIFMLSANSLAADISSGFVDDIEAFDYYSLLSAIGVLEEAEFEDIDFDKEISRAEFAEMIIKAQNCNPESSDNIENIFSDVGFDNEKAPYIEEAYNMGLVSGYGDGKFHPEVIIKENEAVKIIVCALGYEPIAEAKNGYYYGYNDIAQILGILPSKGASANNLVLRNACYLLYKMLVSNTNEITAVSSGITYAPSGEPLLSLKFNIYEVEGVLNAVSGANIYGVPNAGATEIEIDRTKYYVENASEYLGFLGENVRAFVQEVENERLKNLVAVFSNGSKSVTIEADDIYEVSSSSIIYETDGGRKTVKVNSNSRVVYNGVYNRSGLKNVDGDIKVIDSDKDGKYDTIIVWDFKYYVADSFSENKKTVYLKKDMKFEGKTYIELNKDKDNTYMFFLEGEEFAPKDLKADDIISVARSANTTGDKLTVIYVSRDKTDLTIDAIKKGNIAVYNEVDEFDETLVTKKEFKLATGYQNATDEEITAGVSGSFGLTHNGQILVRFKAKTGKNDRLHGYLAEISYITTAFDTKIGFKLLGSNNKWNTIEGAEKITLFATESYHNVFEKAYKKAEYTNLETKLRDVLTNGGTENWHGGLMEYKVDAEGKIKEIYVSYDLSKQPGYIGVDEKNFSLDHSRPFGTQDWAYASWLNSKMRLGGTGFVCYLVPDEIIGSVDEDDFSAVSIGAIGGANDYYYDGFKVYDIREDDRFVSYFVKEYKQGTNTGNAEVLHSAERNVMLVREVVQTADDGVVGYTVRGLMKGKEFSFFVAEDEIDEVTESKYSPNQLVPSDPAYMPDVYYRGGFNVKNLEAGDVIQLSLTATKQAEGFRVLFDVSAEKGVYSDKYFSSDNSNYQGAVNGGINLFHKHWSLYTCYGRVLSYDKKTGIALIGAYVPSDASYDEKYYAKVYQLNREFTDNYLCDGENISRSNAVEISVGDEVFIRSYYNETQTVIVYR